MFFFLAGASGGPASHPRLWRRLASYGTRLLWIVQICLHAYVRWQRRALQDCLWRCWRPARPLAHVLVPRHPCAHESSILPRSLKWLWRHEHSAMDRKIIFKIKFFQNCFEHIPVQLNLANLTFNKYIWQHHLCLGVCLFMFSLRASRSMSLKVVVLLLVLVIY